MWKHPERHPGEYLRARYLDPLGLTASELARRCGMPRSRVSDILGGKRGISADTAVRLAAFFRMDAEDWMALQAEYELGQVDVEAEIVPLDPPGFLVGPRGALRLPKRAPRPKPSLVVPEDVMARIAAEPEPAPYETSRHREVRYPDGTRALVSE